MCQGKCYRAQGFMLCTAVKSQNHLRTVAQVMSIYLSHSRTHALHLVMYEVDQCKTGINRSTCTTLGRNHMLEKLNLVSIKMLCKCSSVSVPVQAARVHFAPRFAGSMHVHSTLCPDCSRPDQILAAT